MHIDSHTAAEPTTVPDTDSFESLTSIERTLESAARHELSLAGLERLSNVRVLRPYLERQGKIPRRPLMERVSTIVEKTKVYAVVLRELMPESGRLAFVANVAAMTAVDAVKGRLFAPRTLSDMIDFAAIQLGKDLLPIAWVPGNERELLDRVARYHFLEDGQEMIEAILRRAEDMRTYI